MDLNISNVVEIQVSEPNLGLGEFNTSNLGIISDDITSLDSFGLFLSPNEVLEYYESDSLTYKMASSIFSQAPNIKNGGGYLAIIPKSYASTSIELSAQPVEGSLSLEINGNPIIIDWDSTPNEIQDAIRLISGLENTRVTYADLTYSVKFFTDTAPVVTEISNTLESGGYDAIDATLTNVDGESVLEATQRAKGLVEFLGLIYNFKLTEQEILDVSDYIQPQDNRTIAFVVSGDQSFLDADTGCFDKVRLKGNEKTRCLFYSRGDDADAILMAASYASRALSTNFDGSNTTQTMHLKDLSGVLPDTSINQTLLNKIIAAGADTYVSIQGVPKVFTSGENNFFDRVYNKTWFIGDCQVGLFNILAQTSYKIPQTEEGVSKLKAVLRRVCEQALVNGFAAAGEWTSPDTFGPIEDFLRNIRERGYFIYSGPVALQSRSDREERKAPLIQVALKEAGAIHKAFVLVNINA